MNYMVQFYIFIRVLTRTDGQTNRTRKRISSMLEIKNLSKNTKLFVCAIVRWSTSFQIIGAVNWSRTHCKLCTNIREHFIFSNIFRHRYTLIKNTLRELPYIVYCNKILLCEVVTVCKNIIELKLYSGTFAGIWIFVLLWSHWLSHCQSCHTNIEKSIINKYRTTQMQKYLRRRRTIQIRVVINIFSEDSLLLWKGTIDNLFPSV